MKPVVLYRRGVMDLEELGAATRHFECFSERTRVQKDDLVIGRYSCWPFYDALEADIKYVGGQLLNSFAQHCYIADLRNWVEDLGSLTPKTWYRLEEIDEDGPYVLKGKTYSRKHDWAKMMFAKDPSAAADVYWRLAMDGLIGAEPIYIRKYVPLKTYMEGLNGLPVTKEFRFFTAFGEILSAGFYWQNYVEDLGFIPEPTEEDYAFVQNEVLPKVRDRANGIVVDIAETAEGARTVVELNDLQQSGLSCNDPERIYSGLSAAIHKRYG